MTRSGAVAARDDQGVAAGARITLIIPTYRRVEMLRECLAALQRQTYPHFVAMVCDNAADPAVGRVVHGLGDPRFRWEPRERNLGILGNVWAGFRSARTDLVMEVDDDDILVPDALALLVAPLLEDPDVVVSFGDVTLVDGHGSPLPPRHPMSEMVTRRSVPAGRLDRFHEVAARGDLSMVAALLRRESIDWSDRPDTAATAYDRHLAVSLARTGRPAHHVPLPVVNYRIHDGADGALQSTPQLQGAITVLRNELTKGPEGDYRRALREELTHTRILQVRRHLEDRNVLGVCMTAWAIASRPWGVRSAASYAARYVSRARARPTARGHVRPEEQR